MMDNLWVRRFRPAAPDAPRLVALPHAGGSAPFYLPLATALSPDVEVLSIQYPGRQERRREPVPGSISELADAILPALPPADDRPVAIFGHSMGALVAYELGLRMEAQPGGGPVHLFVSGRRAPSLRRAGEQVHLLDDAGLIGEMRRMRGTDERALDDPEMLAVILPAVRGDYRAVETYQCASGGRLRSPLTVLTGDADPVTSTADAAAWAQHTTGPCELRTFPGGHFFLVDHAAAVVALIRNTLAAHATSSVRARAARR
ncbi:thioesterase II family protein [Micromonospora sp. NPDC049903]|uniref:thioesterase II family protein n=1 Tax=Micromonospora sp. NPDC049903 TaxID=3364276 RepID=UPI00379C85D4